MATIRDLTAPQSAAGVGTDVTVTVVEIGGAPVHQTVLTLTACPVTLTKATTVSGGGGNSIYTFPEGLILPIGAVADLTITAAGDKSFLAGLGSAVANTGGTLTSTEISFAPQTAATTSGGGHTGTCKMKSTALAPVPGVPLDGTGTAVELFLNACLNSDATGVEALTFGGTITVSWINLGDVA